jgi:hypothetical protein
MLWSLQEYFCVKCEVFLEVGRAAICDDDVILCGLVNCMGWRPEKVCLSNL